jgi:hypothetical protein
MGRWRRLGGLARDCGTVHSQGLTQERDGHMFGHVQAEDAPQGTEPEEPEVQGNAGYQSKQARNGKLENGSLHRSHYSSWKWGWKAAWRQIEGARLRQKAKQTVQAMFQVRPGVRRHSHEHAAAALTTRRLPPGGTRLVG